MVRALEMLWNKVAREGPNSWFVFVVVVVIWFVCLFLPPRKSFYLRESGDRSYEYALGSFAQRLSKYRLEGPSTTTKATMKKRERLPQLLEALRFVCLCFVLLCVFFFIIIGCWLVPPSSWKLANITFNFYDFYDYVLWLCFSISHRSSSNSSSSSFCMAVRILMGSVARALQLQIFTGGPDALSRIIIRFQFYAHVYIFRERPCAHIRQTSVCFFPLSEWYNASIVRTKHSDVEYIERVCMYVCASENLWDS